MSYASRAARLGRRWCAVAAFAVLVLSAAPAGAATHVYVTNSQGDDVSQYAVGAGGLLASLAPPAVPAGEFPQEGIIVSPDGRSVYVAAFAAGFTGGEVLQYDVGIDGTLSPKSPPAVPAGAGPRQLAISPDGRSVYVADFDVHGRVLQFDVGPAGTLSPKSPASVPAGGFPFGVAVSPDGHSVYVTDFSLTVTGIPPDSGVSQYDVGPGGTLAPKQPALVPAGRGPIGVTVSPDGRSVYVANAADATISQYDADAGGTLSAKSPAVVQAGARLLAVSPDGRNVYASSGSVVRHFSVGAGGTLSDVDAAPAAPVVDGLGVSPDGLSLYAASTGGDVWQYDIGADGGLVPKNPPRVAAGGLPEGLAVSPAMRLPTRDECRRGGWQQLGFGNQGQCVAFVERGPKS